MAVRRRFLLVKEAARLLEMTENAIRERVGDTYRLSHVRPGNARRILLIEDEVLALVDARRRVREEKTSG